VQNSSSDLAYIHSKTHDGIYPSVMPERDISLNGCNGLPSNNGSFMESLQAIPVPAQQPEVMTPSSFETDTEELNFLLDYIDLGPLYLELFSGEEEEEEEFTVEELLLLIVVPVMPWNEDEDVNLVWVDEESASSRPPAFDMRDELPGYFEEPMPPKYED